MNDSVFQIMSLRIKKYFVTHYVNNGEMIISFFEKEYLYENQGLLTGLTEKNVAFYFLAKILKY